MTILFKKEPFFTLIYQLIKSNFKITIKYISYNKLREYFFPFIIALSLVIIISFLYTYALIQQTPDEKFMGTLSKNYKDTNGYLSWPSQAAEGHILLECKYLGYTETRLFFHLLWFTMGAVSRITGLSMVSVYHIELLLVAFLIVFIVYNFISIFLKELKWRLLCLFIIFFTSGFGWVFRIFNIPFKTADIYSVEMTVFAALCYEMIIPAAILLIVLSFSFLLSSIRNNTGYKTSILTGLVGLCLGATHTDELIMTYCVAFIFFIYLIVTKNQLYKKPVKLFENFFIMFLFSIPIVIFNGIILSKEPSYAKYLISGMALGQPSPLCVLPSLGLPVFLAFIAIFFIIKKNDAKMSFCIIWMLTVFAIIFIPYGKLAITFQNHAMVGMYIPVSILSVYTLRELAIHYKKVKLYRLILIITLILGLPTNIIHNYYEEGLKIAKERRMFYYIPTPYLESFNWLKQHTNREDVIFASQETSNLIIRESGNRVIWGGYSSGENYNWFFKSQDVNPKLLDKFKNVIAKERIQYIYIDRITTQYTNTRKFVLNSNCKELFSNSMVSIFKIQLF